MSAHAAEGRSGWARFIGVALLAGILYWGSPAAAGAAVSPRSDNQDPAANFSISGRVSDAAERPVVGAAVYVVGNDPFQALPVAWTGDDGRYFVPGVEAGSVRVSVSKAGFETQARNVEVSSSVTVDFVVLPSASITGRVKGYSQTASLYLVRYEDLERQSEHLLTDPGDDRVFSLDAVPPGKYLLYVANRDNVENFTASFYPGVSDPSQATVVDVTPGANLQIEWDMTRGHSVSGAVLDLPTPLAFQVIANRAPFLWHGRLIDVPWMTASGSWVSEGRAFVIPGLADGEYRVRVLSREGADGEYLPYEGYYRESRTQIGATPLAMAGTDIEGVNVRVYPQGTASGTVTSASADVGGAETLITAYRWNGTVWEKIRSIIDWGAYTFGWMGYGPIGLPEGTYTVSFTDPDDERGDDGVYYPFCPQWWNGKVDRAQADSFDVELGKDTPAIDASLQAKGIGCSNDAVITPGALTVSGEARVGARLQVDPGQWSPSPVALTYQWRADGIDLPGETSSALTISPDQRGKRISVAVTGTRPGFDAITIASPTSQAVSAGRIDSGVPTITGTPRVGETLTATPGVWAPGAVELAYQWTADDVPIVGATTRSLTLTGAEAGASISVTVTGILSGYDTVAAESAATTPVVSIPVTPGKPSLAGAPRVGSELTVDPGPWIPSTATFTYQWYADATAVPGATAAMLTLDESLVGKTVSVAVTGRAKGYIDGVVFATAPSPVGPGGSSPSPSASPSSSASSDSTASSSPSAGPSSSPTTILVRQPPDALPSTGSGPPGEAALFGMLLLFIGAMTFARRRRARE